MLIWIKGAPTPAEMRDKIAGMETDFRDNLAEYVESCSQGEFYGGSVDDVRAQQNVRKTDTGYQDPTLTSLVPPSSSYCDCKEPGCEACKATMRWEEQFKADVDDILYRTNLHKCSVRYCLNNKNGTCKARMPRQTRADTGVDLETGALRFKHKEPYLNDVCPLISHTCRCNHDCTPLMSGSAVNHIVYYITEYITKMGPPTHVMFESIKAAFDRSSEMLSGDKSREEKARKLMTRVINILTTKSEIGAPFMAAHLMGLPDRYTSHTFVSFYWHRFINEVKKMWHPPTEEDEEEMVRVMKRGENIIGVHDAQNYIYRADALEDMSLYEFARLGKRVPIPGVKRKPERTDQTRHGQSSKENDTDNECESDDESVTSNDHASEDDMKMLDSMCDNSEAEATEDEQPEDNCRTVPPTNKLPGSMYAFKEGHPLASSYCMQFCPDSPTIVPNMMRPLPRDNAGDDYFLTMLALFKPWRSGLDLKNDTEDWEAAFSAYSFSERQLELMKFFNLRWDCIDSRDDFRKNMKNSKNSKKDSGLPSFMRDDNFDPEAFSDDDVYAVFADTEYVDENTVPVRHYEARKKTYSETQDFIEKTGWTKSDGDINLLDQTVDITYRTPSQWRDIVKEVRQSMLSRWKEIAKSTGDRLNRLRALVDVDIVNKSYLLKVHRARDRPDIIDDTAKTFGLNEDQERAFRIISNHGIYLPLRVGNQ
ncbi:uncharacterized protein SCHCODRAFT_01171578 [Schizophyllum commune H4-8]|nr:uncharacterized protein SCHCODRAFT_01171578 [Schizophyllum commune H4-8]KAI5892449.1 hypothetical protein SCHCODRAFT_01171578 [Schizophyllum commune H4-8]